MRPQQYSYKHPGTKQQKPVLCFGTPNVEGKTTSRNSFAVQFIWLQTQFSPHHKAFHVFSPPKIFHISSPKLFLRHTPCFSSRALPAAPEEVPCAPLSLKRALPLTKPSPALPPKDHVSVRPSLLAQLSLPFLKQQIPTFLICSFCEEERERKTTSSNSQQLLRTLTQKALETFLYAREGLAKVPQIPGIYMCKRKVKGS